MATTTSSKPKGGAAPCRKCGKPGFKDSTGAMQHERRNDPGVYGGRRSDPSAKAKSGEKTDEEPDRDHVLHKKLWGGNKE